MISCACRGRAAGGVVMIITVIVPAWYWVRQAERRGAPHTAPETAAPAGAGNPVPIPSIPAPVVATVVLNVVFQQSAVFVLGNGLAADHARTGLRVGVRRVQANGVHAITTADANAAAVLRDTRGCGGMAVGRVVYAVRVGVRV